MIKLVRLAACQEGLHIHQNATITTTHKAIQLFEARKEKFEHPVINKRIRRHESIGWKTYCDIMAKKRWKFVGEL
jgi:hypothetical protein